MKFHPMFFVLAIINSVPAMASSFCDQSSATLLEMENSDQAVRAEITQFFAKPDVSESAVRAMVSKQNQVDSNNIEQLKKILKACGWPTRSEDSHRAWLIAQHADSDVPFQHEAINLLHAAVIQGHGSAADLAYLTDRIAIAEGKPQLYGTQFTKADRCTMVMKPVDSLEAVAQRRRELGMETLADYEARGRKILIPADCPGAAQ